VGKGKLRRDKGKEQIAQKHKLGHKPTQAGNMQASPKWPIADAPCKIIHASLAESASDGLPCPSDGSMQSDQQGTP
jgi:hypothetical protein